MAPAGWFRWKPAIDWTVALLLLVPAGAIVAILVLLVRATSKGPGLYRQIRVGKDGRHFTIYKIRTMRADAEAASGPVWTRPHDPRITLLGRILRKLHLDELPQIFNVLRGEMSFIGPRPERPEFVSVLAAAVPGYRQRLAVRPGITGLAQVNLPSDTDLSSVRRKLVLDCEYLQRGAVVGFPPGLVYRRAAGARLARFRSGPPEFRCPSRFHSFRRRRPRAGKSRRNAHGGRPFRLWTLSAADQNRPNNI